MIEIIIIALFLIFIAYREWMMNERIKDLELKAFTKNPQEYREYKSVEKEDQGEEDAQQEDEDLVDVFDITPSEALSGLGNAHSIKKKKGNK